MGINPIEYRAWSGKRTGHYTRLYSISTNILAQKTRTKIIIALLVIGLFLTCAVPLIFLAMSPHEELTPEFMATSDGPLNTTLLFLFTIFLSALVTSDLIAEDTRSRSFALYFSRPITPEDYVIGKFAGAFLTMTLFCTIPPIIVAIMGIATQSGSDYSLSLNVLCSTIAAGLLTAFFFLPLGLAVSSFTKRSQFAAIGTFMSFFVLMLIGTMFSGFDPNWVLMSPVNVLEIVYRRIYGFGIGASINAWYLIASFACFIAIPAAILYIRIYTESGQTLPAFLAPLGKMLKFGGLRK